MRCLREDSRSNNWCLLLIFFLFFFFFSCPRSPPFPLKLMCMLKFGTFPHLFASTMAVTGSTFSFSTANEGAAIWTKNTNANLEVINSTFANLMAAGNGGWVEYFRIISCRELLLGRLFCVTSAITRVSVIVVNSVGVGVFGCCYYSDSVPFCTPQGLSMRMTQTR